MTNDDQRNLYPLEIHTTNHNHPTSEARLIGWFVIINRTVVTNGFRQVPA